MQLLFCGGCLGRQMKQKEIGERRKKLRIKLKTHKDNSNISHTQLGSD